MFDGNTFTFGVVTGKVVGEILADALPETVGIVRDSYLAHAAGLANNPRSHFLRFDDRPADRIIALAADLKDQPAIAGLKWIASWPENVAAGIPRASAVMILNRRDTGYPFAVLEASMISAVRTAASAVLAAEALRPSSKIRGGLRVGFTGCGIIARSIYDMFRARNWSFREVTAFDTNEQSARAFLAHAASYGSTTLATTHNDVIAGSDIVVFATTAPKPHVFATELFKSNPLVLNISLRDLSEEIILAANNIVDDVDHCLQAETSPHLTEKLTGTRDFITGTIANVLSGSVSIDSTRPTIFSPFGMGILDLAVGRFVYQEAQRRKLVIDIHDFFQERRRW
jgi:N-[(2S)-2-amino-2-carboxyethyl]-L-glutamate dehydrogenase